MIFAPITEEIVFRAVMIPALYMALVVAPTSENGVLGVKTGNTSWIVVCLNPLCFGMAHLHHLSENLRGGMNLSTAVLSTVVQFTYTFIFGFIATLLLMRTGSIYAAILSHGICNAVGLPDVGFMTPPATGRNARSSLYSCMFAYRYIHLFIHALGLVLFALLVLPLTQTLSESSVYWKY